MNTNLEWIAKNGGNIPEGATCAQYDGNVGRPTFSWFNYDINSYAGRGDVVFTVDEIMQAREELADDSPGWSEWIDWNGGNCPLPSGKACELKFRTGETLKEDNVPEMFYWGNSGGDNDIIAYRYKLDQPEVTEEEDRAFKEIEAKQTKKYSAYFKDVRHLDYIDVYRTVSLFDCDKHGHALSHAAKKLLLTGNRTGGKDVETDVREAIDSLQRWLEMRKEDQLI